MSKTLKLVLSIAGILTLMAGIYIIMMRPSDDTYKKASDTVSVIKKANSNGRAILQVMSSPGYINPDIITELKDANKKYSESLAVLQNDSIINRDSRIKQATTSEAAMLSAYKKSVDGILLSIDNYQAILDACTTLVQKANSITTVENFDVAAKTCSAAINSATSTGNNAFSQQYLTQYASKSKTLLNAYRSLATSGNSKAAQTAAQNNITSAKNDIVALRQTKLTLTPSENVTDSLARIEQVITTQKAAFIK